MAGTKGTNFVDMVKFLRGQRDKALELLPEHLHHYLDEQISVANWYPEEDLIGLVRVLAKIMPTAGQDALEAIARINARHHVRGAYAHLLEGAGRSGLPIRATALWKSMHDTGDMRVDMGEDSAEAELAGWEAPSYEMCMMIGPYLSELFELGGFEGVSVRKTACVREGQGSCQWKIRWIPENPKA